MLVLLPAVQERRLECYMVGGGCERGRGGNLILSKSGQFRQRRCTSSLLTWYGRLLVNQSESGCKLLQGYYKGVYWCKQLDEVDLVLLMVNFKS